MHPKDGRVVSNFIVQALQNKPLTIYGDGSQTRSFCYVDDMVDAFVRLMETSDEITGPMNLGNPSERSMLELAELILKFTKSKSKIIHNPLPQDDPVQRLPDISLAKEIIGWFPKIDIDDGLDRTIYYFKSII